MKLRRTLLVLVGKLALTLIGFASIWALRAFPWWYLAFSALTVSVFAVDAIRSYRRANAQKHSSKDVQPGISTSSVPDSDS